MNPETLINPKKEAPGTSHIWTLSGEEMFPTKPESKKIHIRDVAHTLSMICRFNGHLKEFYSVGEHSLLVETLLYLRGHPPRIRLLGLTHDVTEYLVGDIISPIKKLVPKVKDLEEEIAPTLFQGLGIPKPTESEMEPVHEADRDVMMFEKIELLHPNSHHTVTNVPEGLHIVPYPPKLAAEPFVQRYKMLMKQCGNPLPPC